MNEPRTVALDFRVKPSIFIVTHLIFIKFFQERTVLIALMANMTREADWTRWFDLAF